MKTLIRVGMATCGLAAGARAVYDALTAEIASREFPVQLLRTGCLGACHREVLVEVADEAGSTLYGPITPSRVGSILDRHLSPSRPPVPVEWVVSRRDDRSDYPFLAAQTKVTSRNCGVIDPLSLDDYLATGGYAALQAALRRRPQEIVELVKQSNLRGRGGAGFPTGLKWELTRREARHPRYLICNADEGDPGAFMDRSLIEGDPHALLEGMVIAGYATGASTGYIYIRAEYPLAVKHLRIAIEQARAAGFLGKSILGRDFGFDILIREGAGAFVCGEETALIHSIEGGRGTPRMRPPYPAQSGLWGQPTTINNVETLASIPAITREGPEAFARLGTARSGGTKLFALTGAVQRTGLVEVPIGVPLRQLVHDIGGGAAPGRAVKAVQIGGPSGGCIPAERFDVAIDYENLRETGAIMGSGGLVVVDDGTCMVDLARFFLNFAQNESCGKCVPCRVGTRKLLSTLTRICHGDGRSDDLTVLAQLADTVATASLCGLGKTAPNPVLTTLRYFRQEYEAHVHDHACPAGVCAL